MRTPLLLALAGAALLALGHAAVARADDQTLTFRSAPVTVGPYGVEQSTMLIPSPEATASSPGSAPTSSTRTASRSRSRT